MRISIDGSEWTPSGASLSGKEDLWNALNRFISEQGRVPHVLRVDGEEMSSEAFLALAGGQELQVETRQVRELVRESLDEALSYIPTLRKGFSDIADYFETEKREKALPLLRDAAEGLGWLVKVVENARMLLGVGADDLQSKDLDDALTRLSGLLGDVLGALESGKFFEIAFRLREEVSPQVERLQPLVQGLADLAREGVQ